MAGSPCCGSGGVRTRYAGCQPRVPDGPSTRRFVVFRRFGGLAWLLVTHPAQRPATVTGTAERTRAVRPGPAQRLVRRVERLVCVTAAVLDVPDLRAPRRAGRPRAPPPGTRACGA
ncbi:hypothetical protein GCM10012276_21590 [Nocardioides deserti]|nr:hypothetical protein GCM10012276_21590 [Nocardioides deserti]